jgi:hypothetical protein
MTKRKHNCLYGIVILIDNVYTMPFLEVDELGSSGRVPSGVGSLLFGEGRAFGRVGDLATVRLGEGPN